MMWPDPCLRSTGIAALVTLMTPNRFVSICADIFEACVLYRADVAIARIVDEHIEPAEGFDRCLDGIACCLRVGDIEGQGTDLIAIALDEIDELGGIARWLRAYDPPRAPRPRVPGPNLGNYP